MNIHSIITQMLEILDISKEADTGKDYFELGLAVMKLGHYVWKTGKMMWRGVEDGGGGGGRGVMV